MEKIKILQVNKLYYPEIGGVEKTLQQISEGLNNYPDIDLKVLACQKKGFGKVEKINGVEVHRAGSLGVVSSVPISFSFLWKFRKLSKDRDIVQFHLPFPLGDLACLLSGYKGKVVISWHSDVVKQKRWMILYRPIMKHFLRRADLVLIGAPGIAKGSKYLGKFSEKCKVLPFAIEDHVLVSGGKYLLEHGYERENQETKFLFVGRLVYYKGCSVLLEAMAKMRDASFLTIIGSGSLESDLKQQCHNLGIEGQVEFLGNLSQEKMKRCYEEADVFVLPSVERSEAFALVQLEAMAYGLPVINTNLPSGVPEVSVHMETGLTVEPNDENGLAMAMDWMCCHHEERNLMGQRARERVEKMYTQGDMISNLLAVYCNLLKGGK